MKAPIKEIVDEIRMSTDAICYGGINNLEYILATTDRRNRLDVESVDSQFLNMEIDEAEKDELKSAIINLLFSSAVDGNLIGVFALVAVSNETRGLKSLVDFFGERISRISVEMSTQLLFRVAEMLDSLETVAIHDLEKLIAPLNDIESKNARTRDSQLALAIEMVRRRLVRLEI